MSDIEAKPAVVVIDFADLQKYPPSDLTCACGREWVSRVRFVGPPHVCLISQVPCPGCGFTNMVRRTRGRRETFTL